MSHIMIVDDETSILQALRRLLRVAPCAYGSSSFDLEIETFDSAQAALEHARHHPFDLFLTDYRMPGMDGVAFLMAVKAIQPDAARLIFSGYADLNALMRAVNEVGIDRFIGKPWNDYELVSAIAQSLAHRELMLENRRLADLMRVECGDLTAEQAEAKRLERMEPGITQVNWGPDGSVILDSDSRLNQEH